MLALLLFGQGRSFGFYRIIFVFHFTFIFYFYFPFYLCFLNLFYFYFLSIFSSILLNPQFPPLCCTSFLFSSVFIFYCLFFFCFVVWTDRHEQTNLRNFSHIRIFFFCTFYYSHLINIATYVTSRFVFPIGELTRRRTDNQIKQKH